MTVYARHTCWRVHPALPLLWIISSLLGGWISVTASLLALLLHEAGHALAARWLRLPVSEVEITPWGGVMTVEGVESASPGKRLLLAAGGPLFSLLGCFVSAELVRLGVSFWFAQSFARMNLTLLLINLLPALPLDGGQMLLALIGLMFPRVKAARGLAFLGCGLGASLCGLSLVFAFRGQLILAPAFAGLYLLYSAAKAGKASPARYVTALIARRQQLERGEMLPVELLAVGADTPARALLRDLKPGYYHVVYVLSPDGQKTVATLTEDALCERILQNEPLIPGAEKKEPKSAPAVPKDQSGL